MKRTLTVLAGTAGLVLPLTLVAATPAAAAKPADPGKGGRCVAAGTSLLASEGVMAQAAKGTFDYGPLVGDEGIRLDLPSEGVLLPLETVISLHRTSPGTFAWCDDV